MKKENDAKASSSCSHLVCRTPVLSSAYPFLEHLPPRVHLLLASRVDPDLPLARLRARGQMSEIRDSDLATKIPPTMQIGRSSAWLENDRLRRDGARKLVEAALALGTVQTIIYPSFAFLYPGSGDTDMSRSLRISNRLFKAVSSWQPTVPSARIGWALLAQI